MNNLEGEGGGRRGCRGGGARVRRGAGPGRRSGLPAPREARPRSRQGRRRRERAVAGSSPAGAKGAELAQLREQLRWCPQAQQTIGELRDFDAVCTQLGAQAGSPGAGGDRLTLLLAAAGRVARGGGWTGT